MHRDLDSLASLAVLRARPRLFVPPPMADAYAQWFRASSPYIRAHRGRTFVVMLGADALAAAGLADIVHDLALLHALGVRLVVVHGAEDVAEGTGGPVGAAELAAIESGSAKASRRLEALFTTGMPPSPLRHRHVPLVGGNLVLAQPIGIAGGVDQLAAGRVRRVQTAAIRSLLEAGNVVALPPLGYSAAGKPYVLAPAPLAARVAGDIGADKLILYDDAPNIAGHGDLASAELDALRQASDAALPRPERLDALLTACRLGVARAHLIGHGEDGALLRELFSAEGAGTQVSDDDYRIVRRATADDLDAIAALTGTLAASGALLPRSRARIEQDIRHYFIAELDGVPSGCCALLPLGEGAAELAALVGGSAVGTRLLEAAESAARESGQQRLFALTTQAEDWFLEQGFRPATAASLPAGRRARYDRERNAKVFLKDLKAHHPVDQSAAKEPA